MEPLSRPIFEPISHSQTSPLPSVSECECEGETAQLPASRRRRRPLVDVLGHGRGRLLATQVAKAEAPTLTLGDAGAWPPGGAGKAQCRSTQRY